MRGFPGFFAFFLAGAVALGCATSTPPQEESVEADISLTDPAAEEAPLEPQETPPRSRTLRLGFWEIDLFALDLEPRGTTFRMLDFRIFKLLEVGFGENYHSVSLVEMPNLLNAITTRHEGIAHEHRFADVQALAVAVTRVLREDRDDAETHVMRLPVVGDFYGHELEGGEESRTILYLFRQDLER